MGRKIYITESQMKGLTRLILRENVNLNYVKQFISNITPIIDFIEIKNDSDGQIGLIYTNENNEEISIYVNFEYNYGYEGVYRSATTLTPEEKPEFNVNGIIPVDMSIYVYTNDISEEIENINVNPNSTYYDLCIQILEEYEDEIDTKIEEGDYTKSYNDYEDEKRERSLGI